MLHSGEDPSGLSSKYFSNQEKGRLGMVDLLVKIACFAKKCKDTVLRATGLNSSLRRSMIIRLPLL